MLVGWRGSFVAGLLHPRLPFADIERLVKSRTVEKSTRTRADKCCKHLRRAVRVFTRTFANVLDHRIEKNDRPLRSG
ncbi:hypothetical protein TNCV_228601 [Trichonephila clavipes]|nr:hypothetical protein TNCV_228601 [Trichonephila clavipes]